MSQPNKFQFILNIRNVITEVLDISPENWLNTSIKFTRSKTYNGLFRGETLPIKYVAKAAMLLRKEFYKAGILAFVKNVVNLRNNNWGYDAIYNGRLDFSTVSDELTSFTVNSISDDFSIQLNANDGTDYAIPLNVPEAINIELTPLALRETADLNISTTTDFRANAFFEISVTNNERMSVNPSVGPVGFFAQAGPTFDKNNPYFFFIARMNTAVRIQGAIQSSINSGHYQFNIYKSDGTLVYTLKDVTYSVTTQTNFFWDFVLNVNTDDRLFFYIYRLDSVSTGPNGVNMQSGTISLSYQTISPGTMCQALPAAYLFGQLLQAMNTNTDSGPNQPVPYKSNLLTGPLPDLVITSSDSIRTALGSLFRSGATIFPGTYKVVAGSILYGGQTFNTGDIFPYLQAAISFTGTGVIEKVVSGFVGQVYNPGDTLQAGGTYLVGGNPGTHITYNSIVKNVGEFFTFFLGVPTFTGSDPSSFVEQTGFAPQLITNFRDFFQSIYSIQGGDCAFGIENGTCFIENLAYVYRATIGNLDAGTVDTSISFKPATDMMFNTIKVGYRDQQYDQLNGYFEVNSEQSYKTSILNPKKELNLVSVYRADPYGIEQIRVSQNDTAASRSDNDCFFVWKKTNPENTVPFTYYHPLRTEGLTSITGVDSSYYNWIISPKQNLLRGGRFLSSIFYGMKGYLITLTAAPKNTAMVTIDTAGRRVAESEPVAISSLQLPLFIPVYASFKPGLPTNALEMIDSVPYGFIKFKFNGVPYKMFADTISVDIGQNTQQEFKGLLTTGNDLTTLIR